MKVSRRLAAIMSISAVVLGSAVVSSAPAMATNYGLTNTSGVWDACDSSDPAIEYTVGVINPGDVVGIYIAKFTDVATYTTTILPQTLALGDAVTGTVYSYSVDDVAALAQQLGITDWPLELNIGAFPAGTTDFGNTQSDYDYAAYGVEFDGSIYHACAKPVLPEAPEATPAAEALPATGTNVESMALAGFAAATLLAVGGLVLLVQRRRKSI